MCGGVLLSFRGGGLCVLKSERLVSAAVDIGVTTFDVRTCMSKMADDVIKAYVDSI